MLGIGTLRSLRYTWVCIKNIFRKIKNGYGLDMVWISKPKTMVFFFFFFKLIQTEPYSLDPLIIEDIQHSHIEKPAAQSLMCSYLSTADGIDNHRWQATEHHDSGALP